ncbi:MAG TPA: type I DNA topoisomerase [bacterium]|nr:type I DNA topoisomerase [bacterium]
MPKSLVIVESDAKAKTINRYLGNEYVVRASVGHIKNLPKNRLGVDIDNGFEPEYITIRGRGKLLSELRKLAAASDRVYLATDPDREGEAIAQHLAEEIGKVSAAVRRVLFHEITEDAIREAIRQAHDIDNDRVEAQKARRVMDRLVGYQVSPFLWQTLYRGLSAGRVQSVALRLVCEREEEIQNFKSREYWTIEAEFLSKGREVFRSKLIRIDGRDADIPDESEANRHGGTIQKQDYRVENLAKKIVERKPFPPYTTSTLQQDAVRRLGMTTKQVMAVAQQLYEGIDLPEGRTGLITYMRTDSTRLAASAVEEARRYVAENYGLEYVPQKPRFFRNKKSAQDAHEAIRPTSLQRPPNRVASYLNPNQKKLYTLIWNRYIACQMASAKIEQTSLDIAGGPYLFRTTGSVVQFRGFMQLYEVEPEEEASSRIPERIRKGEPAELKEIFPGQHFTKPPARYNESSLVKELDNLGIGRPSTYALIISTLLERKYAEKEGRSLKPTDLGKTVKDIVVNQFPDIFNVGFTARMEQALDRIESGEKDRAAVLDGFYKPFGEAVHRAMENKQAIREALQEETDHTCQKCGSGLVVKWGRNGRFMACSAYPECRYTRPLEDAPEEKTGVRCETCGAPMAIKTGRFGRFLACTRYPDCKSTKPLTTGVRCPEPDCPGEILERRSGRGKTFYGCSAYPKCKFATWNRPVPKPCDQCGNSYLELRSTRAKGESLRCPKCKAEYEVHTA